MGSFQLGATQLPNGGFSTDQDSHEHLLVRANVVSNSEMTAANYVAEQRDEGFAADYSLRGTNNTPDAGRTSAYAHTHNIQGGDSESRPRNAAVVYIVRAM